MIVEYIQKFGQELLFLFIEMAPYLLLGFALAGILHVYFPKQKVAKYLGRKNLKSVFNAAILGIPLPLCSCGVIPTGISFHQNGASKGATVSFLISTPQTGVDSILVTYSLLGLPFALIRPIAAFITGIFGGALTNAVDDEKENLYEDEPERIIKGSKVKAAFNYAFVEFLQDIAKWLMIGLAIAALFATIIPDGFIESNMGYPILNMIIVLIASIPMYVCATGSIPIAAVLMMKGLSPGAAFVFLMAGPATNAATITVIKQSLGMRSLMSYLGSIMIGAIGMGLIINLLPPSWFLLPGMTDGGHVHSVMELEWWAIGSAIVLAVLLLNGVRLHFFPPKLNLSNMDSNKVVYAVEGMTCNHCKSNVETNLSKISNIQNVEVDLASNSVVVTGENISDKEIETTVSNLGYTYNGVKS